MSIIPNNKLSRFFISLQKLKREEEAARLQELNRRLEAELAELKMHRTSSTSSMNSVCPASPTPLGMTAGINSDGNGPLSNAANGRLRTKLSGSMHEQIRRNGVVCVDGAAEVGDRVMIVWSEEHNNFALYSESNSPLHFLHTDSFDGLSLVAGASNGRRYTTAEVVDKDYCQAKKAGNRFRVPQGTKFYRVKCVPIKDQK